MIALLMSARVNPHICLCFFIDGSSTKSWRVSGCGYTSFMYGSSGTEVSPRGPWTFNEVVVAVRVTEG